MGTHRLTLLLINAAVCRNEIGEYRRKAITTTKPTESEDKPRVQLHTYITDIYIYIYVYNIVYCKM